MSHMTIHMTRRRPLFNIHIRKKFYNNTAYPAAHELYVCGLYMWGLCMWGLYMWGLCMWGLYMWGLYMWGLCMWGLCMWGLCMRGSCVGFMTHLFYFRFIADGHRILKFRFEGVAGGRRRLNHQPLVVVG